MAHVLERIEKPADLRGLSEAELAQLAAEVRTLIIDTVSRTGGHLAANLGVVELTIALLRVFDPPADKILWDTSHQCYAYKILTGRRDRFGSLRQWDGLSGFIRRDESKYDVYGAGHAGTALSAALGMAVGRDRRGSGEHVVAVVGDASVGCGISFEALNNLAAATRRLIVVLNDNEMSIGANVGSLSRYLGDLLSSPRYNRWKRSVESMALRLRLGWLRSGYYRIEEALKSLFLRSVIFEEFGLRYVGPIDGHSLHALTDALTIARDSARPIILHVSTRKGQGYSYAEKDPEKWHATAGFDVASGCPAAGPPGPTYSAVFGATLERLAESDPRIVAITAGMPAGTGLTGFAAKFPDRFFDVGISEEHAVVFAAGLAAQGFLPVFAVYSTFVQRAVDCILHDVCLQNLPVIFCLDRAGIVGDDGPTHHGVFDLALLRPAPGLVIMQPSDETELANLLFTATRLAKPAVIRYPRGCGPGAPLPEEYTAIEPGSAQVVEEGERVQIWSLGDMLPLARHTAARLRAAGTSAGVVNARFVRPLDTALLARQADRARVVATVENGIATGGFGSEVEEALVARGFSGRVLRFGWPDGFVPQGTPGVLMERYGLTPAALADRIAGALGNA
jgi:1-deoxy-D-xylulose-5-phosphate synthase